MATALGYNNFHALKSKENHDLSKMDKLKGCKKFIIKTDSSTGDDFKRIEAMIVSIPLDVIFLINRVLGKERFDLVDQFVIKTNKVQLNNLDEFSNDLQYELDNNPFIGLQNNNFINASYDDTLFFFEHNHLFYHISYREDLRKIIIQTNNSITTEIKIKHIYHTNQEDVLLLTLNTIFPNSKIIDLIKN